MLFDVDFKTWDVFNLFETKSKNSQKMLLRDRYYKNLSILESLAVYYNSLGYIVKGLLYTSLSAGWLSCAILFYNPIALISLSLGLAFMVMLDYQYSIMDARFERMVQDLDISEQQLKEASNLSLDLENQARNCIEKNQETVHHLQETREKIEGTYHRLSTLEQRVEIICKEAESAVESISVETQEMIANYEDLPQKLQNIRQGLLGLSSIFNVQEHLTESARVLENSRALREQVLLRLDEWEGRYLERNPENLNGSPTLGT